MLKNLFHIFNFFLITLYLYPGSIFGYIFYRNFDKQPQLTPDLSSISSNHVYTFLFLSTIGVLSFKNLRKITIYLISISIILELFHLIIPKRSFQFGDLFGNLIGVILPIILLVIYNYWRKK